MNIKPNLPLNTENQKKPTMPNVENRVDAFVISDSDFANNYKDH